MKISPFVPLQFPEANESDGLPSRYVQTFATTDKILLQIIAAVGDDAPSAALLDAHTGGTVDTISWQSWQVNAEKLVYFAELDGLDAGHYRVSIGSKVSEEFIVTADADELANTTLIQYRFKDNRQRDDVLSVIGADVYFFDFRVPGGFKDSGVQFGVTNEQFTTQHEDLVELYATDYVIKTFTLGNAMGVPVWYGEMLNRILTCSYVYFNGDRYTRNESEVPTMNVLVDGLDSFVFTQTLRKHRDAEGATTSLNRLALRRVEGQVFRVLPSGELDDLTLRLVTRD